MLFESASTCSSKMTSTDLLEAKRKQVTRLFCYFLPQTLIIDYSFFSREY